MARWIRVQLNVATNRKALHLGRALTNPLGFGYLVKVWAWAAENAKDGWISPDDFEHAAGWKGRKGNLFTQAKDAGYLDPNHTPDQASDGSPAKPHPPQNGSPTPERYMIHDWWEHNGKAIAKADRDAARARKNRESKQNVRESDPDASANERATDARRSGLRSRSRYDHDKDDRSGVPADLGTEGSVDRSIGHSPGDFHKLWASRTPPLKPWPQMTTQQSEDASALIREFTWSALENLTAKIAATPFLLGDNDRSWEVTPQRVLKDHDLVRKILNGEYDKRPGNQLPTNGIAKPMGSAAMARPAMSRCEARGCTRDALGEIWGKKLCQPHGNEAISVDASTWVRENC